MAHELEKQLKVSKHSSKAPSPEFFQLTKKSHQDKLAKLLEDNPHTKIIDTYEGQLKELFTLDNPALHMNPPERDKQFKPFRDEHYGKHEPWQAGNWVSLPWRHTLLHLLEDDAYQQVRTGRNRNLITAEEQTTYYNSTIGIAGLSVGNSVALTLVLTGGGKHLKLADPDILELTNLNRIRGSIAEITEPKVYMTARQIYELDPYADLTLYPEGVTPENMSEFFEGLDVIVDEIDNLPLKLALRTHAKQHKLPLVMATDNGDSGILDVERYDQDQSIEPFHGRGKQEIEEIIASGKKPPLPVIGKLIGEKLVGFDITEPRMQQSLLQIGRSIPTWPQLGSAATLNGVIIATTIRRILTDQPVTDNRALASVPHIIEPGYDSEKQIQRRKQDTAAFTKEYNQAIEKALARKPERIKA